MPHGTVNNPLAFVSIAPDGTVTIVCHRSEMGQGVRTGMPLIVADEMEADWARVKVAQATGRRGQIRQPGHRRLPFDPPFHQADAPGRRRGAHDAGSGRGQALGRRRSPTWRRRTTRSSRSRPARSSAMESSPPTPARWASRDVSLEKSAPTPAACLKDPSQFRYIGKEGTNIVDGFNITTGRATYGQDVRLPGQKYAVIARPPVMGGKVASYDATEAKKVPGVVQIVEIPAPSYPDEIPTVRGNRGHRRQHLGCDPGPQGAEDHLGRRPARDLRFRRPTARQMEATAKQPGKILRSDGDFAAAYASADKKVEAEYYIPHNAHATMEPPSATCRIVDGKAEVWTSVQSPQAAHDMVAAYLGLPPENVTVNVTLLGGGFGRKSKPDFAVEAALCSKAIGGAPVKVVWTREDDIHNDFYHTVSVERLEAGLDKDGKVVAWRHNSVAPTILSLFAADPKHEMPLEQGMGLVDMPFDVKNISIENGEAEAHTKIGWWRSVSNVPHGFAIQSFVAELAAAAGKDQKTFLLDLIGPPRILDVPQKVKNFWDYGENPEVYPIDTGRLRNVVELVTEKAGWGKREVPKGHGLGLAVHRSFVSYVAAVIEAAVDEKGNVTVPRVDIAVDCGPIVNPDRVRSQFEGAVVMGLGVGLLNEISFKDGRVQQSNLDDYQVLQDQRRAA